MIFLRLFYEFFLTGLFSIGGGLATLPFLQSMALRTGWFTTAELADMLAVSESTPGPIGVNMATYVGFSCAGIPGALAATIGLVTPSVIVILLVAIVLDKVRHNRWVEAAFTGLRPASAGLIAAAGWSVVTMTILTWDSFRASGDLRDLLDWRCLLLAVVIWVCSNKLPKVKTWHPVVWIALSAAVGIVFEFGA